MTDLAFASATRPIDRILANIIVISGNNQKRGEATGMDRLGWRLRSRYSSAVIKTHIIPWNGDIAGTARFIGAHSAPHPECVNIGLHYSWGWGRGGYRLGYKLLKQAHCLDHVIIVDGVPRPLSRIPGDLFWGNVLFFYRGSDVHEEVAEQDSAGRQDGPLLPPDQRLAAGSRLQDEGRPD